MEIKNRKARVIPFGWQAIGDNLLKKIPLEFTALENARWLLEQGKPIGKVRNWLINTTGRQISQTGMLKAVKNVEPREPQER